MDFNWQDYLLLPNNSQQCQDKNTLLALSTRDNVMPRLNFLILTFCLQFATLVAAQTEISYLPGKFVRADLVTPNLAISKTFYAELFGWKFNTFSNYAVAHLDDRELGRIFEREPPKGSPSRAFLGSVYVGARCSGIAKHCHGEWR
jgi:hypothetical protein